MLQEISLSKRPVTVKSSCLEKHKEAGEVTYTLKRRHEYYYQVQCQMYCSKVEWCDFVLRTNKDLHVQRIPWNPDWWKQQLPQLKEFYFDALLPELACPRQGKGGIREPPAASNWNHAIDITPITCIFISGHLFLSLTLICIHHYYTNRTEHMFFCTIVHVLHSMSIIWNLHKWFLRRFHPLQLQKVTRIH